MKVQAIDRRLVKVKVKSEAIWWSIHKGVYLFIKREKVLLDLFSENEVMEVEKRQFGGGG